MDITKKLEPNKLAINFKKNRLRSLTKLYLANCNLSEDGILVDFGGLSSLQILDLSRNNFRNLHDCISRLPELYSLSLCECLALQTISGLSASVLDASGKTQFRPTIKENNFLPFCNFHKLIEIKGLENLEFGSAILAEGCNNLAYDFRSNLQVPLSLSRFIM